jgi:hypothetical protein
MGNLDSSKSIKSLHSVELNSLRLRVGKHKAEPFPQGWEELTSQTEETHSMQNILSRLQKRQP